MKHLLYLMVVVNLVYFLWHMMQGMPGEGIARELPPLPPDTRRLMTLQELQDKRARQGADNISADETPTRRAVPVESPVTGIETLTRLEPPAAGLALTCLSVGPLLSEAELNTAADRVDALELASKRRTDEEVQQIGYWIHLPAMPRKEVLEYTALLDKHRDKEYFIGKDNVLSLGAFKEESRANRRMRELERIGIEAVLQPRFKRREVSWLDLAEAVSAAERQRIAAGLSGFGIEERACR